MITTVILIALNFAVAVVALAVGGYTLTRPYASTSLLAAGFVNIALFFLNVGFGAWNVARLIAGQA